jgi:hypothetical protein
LHSLKQILMFPSRNPPLWACRALRFERIILSGGGVQDRRRILPSAFVWRWWQPLSGWTAIGQQRQNVQSNWPHIHLVSAMDDRFTLAANALFLMGGSLGCKVRLMSSDRTMSATPTAIRSQPWASPRQYSAADVEVIDDYLNKVEQEQMYEFLQGPGWGYGALSHKGNNPSPYWFKHFAGFWEVPTPGLDRKRRSALTFSCR